MYEKERRSKQARRHAEFHNKYYDSATTLAWPVCVFTEIWLSGSDVGLLHAAPDVESVRIASNWEAAGSRRTFRQAMMMGFGGGTIIWSTREWYISGWTNENIKICDVLQQSTQLSVIRLILKYLPLNALVAFALLFGTASSGSQYRYVNRRYTDSNPTAFDFDLRVDASEPIKPKTLCTSKMAAQVVVVKDVAPPRVFG